MNTITPWIMGIAGLMLSIVLPIVLKCLIVPLRLHRYPKEIVTRILRYGISSAVMLTLFYLMAIYIAVNASQTGELVPLSGLVFGALIMATGIAVSCLAAYQPYKRHRHKK